MQPEPAGGGFSHVETLCGLGEGTQFPRVPSFTPISRATSAIGRDVSITSFTASSLNSGVNFRRLSGTDDHLHSGPDLIGSGVRDVGGTPPAAAVVFGCCVLMMRSGRLLARSGSLPDRKDPVQ